ncbi:MAG: hypothetical protein U9O89_00775 [Thermoproteota archaeon]|nr:hypothetical protein [Thermoproteota archaeon]
MSSKERCRNPWKSECKNTDIELYILYKDERRPICRGCWAKIAEKELQW